jgi:hypothetical protein
MSEQLDQTEKDIAEFLPPGAACPTWFTAGPEWITCEPGWMTAGPDLENK